MSRGGPAAVMVAELVSSGRGAAAQPAFEPGLRVPLIKSARGGASVGDLVTVSMQGPRRAGDRGARPRVVAHRRAPGAARVRGPRAAVPAGRARRGRGARRERRRRRSGSPRPAPAAGRHHRPARRQGPRRRHRDRRRGRRGDARLWVHIADVARFVAAGGALDREAARRGCSVYVPGHGHADAAAAAVVRPLQPPPGRRPRRRHGRDGHRRARGGWGRPASRGR